MWAARPHLGSIFKKLLHRKTFQLPVACLRNTIQIRFGKAGAHPQLAWESQLPLKPYLSLQPFIFKGNCDSFDSLLDFCLISLNSFYLLRKCGLLAHTSAAFLKNCYTEKRFICASHKPLTLLFPYRYAIMKQISERSICLCIAYSSPSLP